MEPLCLLEAGDALRNSLVIQLVRLGWAGWMHGRKLVVVWRLGLAPS